MSQIKNIRQQLLCKSKKSSKRHPITKSLQNMFFIFVGNIYLRFKPDFVFCQHFTSCFFVQERYLQLFCSCSKFLYLFGKKGNWTKNTLENVSEIHSRILSFVIGDRVKVFVVEIKVQIHLGICFKPVSILKHWGSVYTSRYN